MKTIKTIKAGLIVSLALVTILSCKKDNNNPSAKAPCKLKEVYFFVGNNTTPDTGIYVYNGNNIAKIQFKNIYFSLDYKDDKLIKRSLYDTVFKTPYSYDTIIYNSDETVAKIDGFHRISNTYSGSDIYKKVNLAEFEHTNNKLTKGTSYAIVNGVVNPNSQIFDYTYTGDNITKLVFTDHWANQPTTTTNYTYDNKENYYLKHSRQPWLTEFLMQSFWGGDLPAYISANNIIP